MPSLSLKIQHCSPSEPPIPEYNQENSAREPEELLRSGASKSLSQQFTYGVVSEGVVAESLRKFCGDFAEICKKYVPLRQERVRKFCGKFAEISRRLRKIFCNDPFPNDPISELQIAKEKAQTCFFFPRGKNLQPVATDT